LVIARTGSAEPRLGSPDRAKTSAVTGNSRTDLRNGSILGWGILFLAISSHAAHELGRIKAAFSRAAAGCKEKIVAFA
jgi:hypothetical protein